MKATRLAVVLTLGASVSLTAVDPQRAQPPAPSGQARAPIAQLWVEPEPDRDLFYGVGGERLAPDPAARYKVIEIKVGGYSQGYTVVDPSEREWSTKLPPEAGTEVALSRILWGLGFHQAPSYLLPSWNADGARAPNPQLPARFREKSPDFHGLESGDGWEFTDNPFVGTRPLGGLLVLQAIVENPDIKASNNTIYALKTPVEGASRWYVVRDLGYALGRSAFNGPRGDVDAFENAPFIKGVVNGQVALHYGGRLKSKLDTVTVADVHWICQRLAKLTDRQWRDAFRAGGHEPSIAERYIRALKKRIAEGLALPADPPRG